MDIAENLDAICENCNQPYMQRVKHGQNKQRFCSDACRVEWHARNPLERESEFSMSLMNPNPSFRTRKDGDHYLLEFEVSRDEWQWFTDPNIDRTGMVIETQAQVTHRHEKAKPKSVRPYGKEAQALKQSSFFRTPDVWRELGTDDEFLKWIRSMPCAVCRNEITVEAAHVRRIADGAGTGIKPQFSAIPLCAEHHRLQHQQGESAIGGKEWVDKQRIEHVGEWAWAQLKAELGYESMAEAPPERIQMWAIEHDVQQYLPSEYDVPMMLRKQAD